MDVEVKKEEYEGQMFLRYFILLTQVVDSKLKVRVLPITKFAR
jgi:hypothetical protein